MILEGAVGLLPPKSGCRTCPGLAPDLPRATCPGLAQRWPPTCPPLAPKMLFGVYALVSFNTWDY